MNWLQKISDDKERVFSQSLAPTYLGVGHNYRWNEDKKEYEELWEAKNNEEVIVWYYKNGKIQEQEQYGPHWLENDDARGRIETGTRRGSIDFNTKDFRLQRHILSELIKKYPGIRFGVYGIKGGPFTIQEYWELI